MVDDSHRRKTPTSFMDINLTFMIVLHDTGKDIWDCKKMEIQRDWLWCRNSADIDITKSQNDFLNFWKHNKLVGLHITYQLHFGMHHQLTKYATKICQFFHLVVPIKTVSKYYNFFNASIWVLYNTSNRKILVILSTYKKISTNWHRRQSIGIQSIT